MNKSIYFAGREQIINSTHTSWILCSRNDSNQYYPAKTVWSKLTHYFKVIYHIDSITPNCTQDRIQIEILILNLQVYVTEI